MAHLPSNPSGEGGKIPRMRSTTGFDGIANFRFISRLGSGSFATTYLAERDGEQFAVKVLNEPLLDPQAAERFNREILSLRISHPNLAEYVDSGVGMLGGRELPYIAMRYVEGASLREHLAARGGRLPWPEAVTVARGLAEGLGCLHDHAIIHRDLKPANSYIPSAGGVVILDFGLASMLDLTTITAHDQILGTPAYCSPEQIRGETDVHTDLYALGVTLFQMLTGGVPFPAKSLLELLVRIQSEEPEPPSAVEPTVPDWLDRLVLMLLAKEPLQRPRDAPAVLQALTEQNRFASPVRPPYERAADPILVVRTGTKSAAHAVADAAMQGEAPDVAITAITRPADLEELHRARAASGMRLAVDTRVMDTAVAGYRSIAALANRQFLPVGPEPHTPTSLRAAGETERVARGDMRDQLDERANLLRATAFPIEADTSGWLQRDARLLDAALAAREALAPTDPLWAFVPIAIEALTHQDHRLSIANRFARGEPDGYWLGVADVDAASADQIAAAVHFALMLQELGGPCIWTVPGWLAELAWSLGVAGVEVPLGRVGGFRLPSGARHVRRKPPPRRFEFPSLLGSFDVEITAELLARSVLPESDCPCPSCGAASTPAEAVAHADDHNMWVWSSLRAEIGRLDIDARVARYRAKLDEATRLLAPAGKVAPAVRWRRNDIKRLRNALEVVIEEEMLATPMPLRRAS